LSHVTRRLVRQGRVGSVHLTSPAGRLSSTRRWLCPPLNG
jgi:hypothetical protein